MYKVVVAEKTNATPVDLATLGQWAVEGRIGRDTLVQDTQSGRQFRAGDHLFLANRLPKLAAIAPPPSFDSRNGEIRNTSGQDGDVPPEVSGWNWGAFGMGVFGMGWLWGINQRITRVFAVLFPVFVLHVFLFGLIWFGSAAAYFAGSALSACYYAIGAYLGANGSRLAWQHRQFRDIEDFKACQRVWGWWATGLLIGGTFTATVGMAAIAGYSRYSS